MRKILCFLMIMVLTIGEITVSGADETKTTLNASELYAKSAVLMDGGTKRVLYGKEQSIPLANASTTKIMTCIVALEAEVFSDSTTASKRAVRQPKVQLGMEEGTKYQIKDLLYCLMLESYNDCAVAIAEHVAGSVEAFAAMMNEKALEIGCKDTYFITPNGLDDKNEISFHHTTAEDLCRIMAYCSWESPKAEEFCQITQTMSYSFETNGKSYSISNHNQLFHKIDGVVSGKTGFTADAGYCYVASFEQEGKKMCLALLGCGWPNNKNYKWEDSLTLLEYGLTNYEVKDIYEEPFLEKKLILEGISPDISISNWRQRCYLKGEINDTVRKLEYLVAEEDEICHEIEWKDNISAPIQKGEVLGYHHIFMNEVLVFTENIIAEKSIEKWDFSRFFELSWQKFFLI